MAPGASSWLALTRGDCRETSHMTSRIWSALAAIAIIWLCLSSHGVADVPAPGSAPLGSPTETVESLTRKILSGALSGKPLADAYFGRCQIRARMRDIKGAAEDCTQSIAIADSGPPHATRAALYVLLKNYPAALEDFAAMTRFSPKDPTGHALSASLYWILGDMDKFAVESDAAMALTANPLPALKQRGELYFNNGYWEKALADYETILSREPDNALILHYRGDAKSHLGRYEEGMADYERALKLDATQAPSLAMSKALSLFDQRRYEDALAQIQIAADSGPDNAYPLLWLNLIRAHAGKPDEADFSRRSEKLDRKAWPYSVVAFELGKLPEDQVWAAANAGSDPATLSNQMCEANFYMGEYKLARDKGAATKLLEEAAGKCFKGFVEYNGAVFELHALGEDIKFGR